MVNKINYSGKAYQYEVKRTIKKLSTKETLKKLRISDDTKRLQILSPIKQHLFVCAKEMYVEAFYEVQRFLDVGIIDIKQEFRSYMIHKAEGPELTEVEQSLYATTALNWTNKNNDARLAFELLKLEEEAHTDKLEALQCMKENLNNVELFPWIVDTHNHFHPDSPLKTTCLAGLEVLFIIFTYMFLVYDYYSDISLIFDYKDIANANTSVIHSLLACNTSSENFQNSDYSKINLNETFQNAMIISIVFISAAIVFQLIVLILFNPITDSCKDFFGLKDRIAKLGEKSKLIIITFLKLSRFIIHLMITFVFKSSTRKDHFLDLKTASDNVLDWIMMIQRFGNSLQLILQIWLLNPFFLEIMDWNFETPIFASFNGIENILTFDRKPACYLEKAFGKILWTLLSFSLGIAIVRANKPINSMLKTPFRILMTFFSIFSQALARIIALSSLNIMQVNSELFKYILFFILHTIVIAIINILFGNRKKKKETRKEEDCMKTIAKRFLKILISSLSSTIIMVHIPKQRTKGGGQLLSFLSHTSFFVVVLFENMALALLPSLLPHLYPDKFPWRLCMVISILVLWLISVVLQENMTKNIAIYKFSL